MINLMTHKNAVVVGRADRQAESVVLKVFPPVGRYWERFNPGNFFLSVNIKNAGEDMESS